MLKNALEIGSKVAGNILPPSDEASPAQLKRWRYWVAGVLMANSAGLLAHIALACGMLPWYSGFAASKEVEAKYNEIQEEFRLARANALEAAIPDMQKRYCLSKGELQTIYLEKLNGMYTEYFRLKKISYPQVSCSDLVKGE